MEDYRQISKAHIPGWINSPAWANWLQFCSTRGWLFMDKQPECIYRDGHAASHGVKIKKACSVENVAWLQNKRNYSGRSRPWPEDMPNN